MGISKTLKTIKPLVAHLTPAERLELVHWITDTKASPSQPTHSTKDAPDDWRSRISAEAQNWYARPDRDRQPYLGQHVAVLAGQVVDYDADRIALYQRIQKKYPDTPVLITTAEARRPREFLVLSPHLGSLKARIWNEASLNDCPIDLPRAR